MSGVRKEIRLSSQGMQQVCEHDQTKFHFLVGDVEYECGLSEACFLSPLVRRLLVSDCTSDSLFLNICDEGHVFEEVMRLGTGESVVIDDHNLGMMKNICLLLENSELYDDLVDIELWDEELNIENVVSRLLMNEELGLDSSPEISFIASHFSEIDVSSVGVHDLERILCDSDLKLKDENSLVDFIVEGCESYEEYYCLFRYVALQYVDLSHLNVYLDQVYPEHLDEGIWSCICCCLRGQFENKGLPISMSGNRFVKTEPRGETY